MNGTRTPEGMGFMGGGGLMNGTRTPEGMGFKNLHNRDRYHIYGVQQFIEVIDKCGPYCFYTFCA
jgi:hypothetical protein